MNDSHKSLDAKVVSILRSKRPVTDWDDAPLPLAIRNPVTESCQIIGNMERNFYELWPEFPPEFFIDRIVMPLYEDKEGSGDRFLREVKSEMRREKEGHSAEDAVVEAIWRFQLACAFSVDGIRAVLAGDVHAGWCHVSRAAYWGGVVTAQVANWTTYVNELRENARRAARASHARHYAEREVVNEWCRLNLSKYSSMDKAAADVAGVIVHKSIRTVRAWIGDFRSEHPVK